MRAVRSFIYSALGPHRDLRLLWGISLYQFPKLGLALERSEFGVARRKLRRIVFLERLLQRF
jgi:hypothetical protein